MENIFNYVEKYGDISFSEKKFNDIDNLVFALFNYLDFTKTDINRGNRTIETIGYEYLNANTYKDISKIGVPQRDAYKLLKILVLKERYKNIVLADYIYIVDHEKQFSAVTFKIDRHLSYICFEGTDQIISGWKEDGEMACRFPIPSHIEAVKYVDRNVRLFGPKVIIGGHSKGGNLALVAGMYMKKYKKFKVQKIYSNDGPGLRKREFESREYKKIKKKYIHIVPDYCIIGVLLRNDIYTVVKSSRDDILSHSITTWAVEDDYLVPHVLSEKSKNFEKGMLDWLDRHDDVERMRIIKAFFKVFEDAQIEDTVNMVKIKNIFKIIHNLNNIDKETKELMKDFFVFNYKNLI